MTRFLRTPPIAVAAAALVAGCNRHQSALAPFGAEAEGIRSITIALVVGAVVIAASVAALARHATRAPQGQLTTDGGMRLILWLGGIVPAAVLAALLIYSLPTMRPRTVNAADLRIQAVGEQFWFRVRYRAPGAAVVAAANEVRVPVGRTVLFELSGGDVIHSFWIPGLAGKMDMIPGRVNRLPVLATKAGRYRGVCTEFCGLSHALMAFEVVAMPPADFDRWLAAQRRPALASSSRGRALFDSYGCGGCHAIRGHGPASTIGPDLTHFGDRRTVGAGILPQTEAAVASFIRHPEDVKPGVRMPAFAHMPARDATLIARYLKELR
ncbi:c-type cytochrome [uncultured Sphingomonas sp.]|uniref:cytochrome c oxidase subunit II n=1 Tax=uncultured Sphingomonas sp. TaxID=158754 RepID=UPI0035CCA541